MLGRILGLVFIALLSVESIGQQCGLDHFRPATSPEEVLIHESKIQRWIEDNKTSHRQRSVLTLPVIVHVIYRTPEQNISDEQIYSQLEVLNEDFRMLNDNRGITPSAFQDLAKDVELEFCLAKHPTDTAYLKGIIRKETTFHRIGMSGRFYQSSLGGSDPVNPKKYINIYVCELAPGLLGYASVPYEQWEFDGIVVQPHFFGRKGTALGSAPNELGRTTSHEMGHYLGLEHLWGRDDSSCSEDDMVEDTPPQEVPTYECPDFPVRDLCTPAPTGIMFNNFMDYTDDACTSFFTEGQKARMWANLNVYRSGLMSGADCSTVSTNSPVNNQPKIQLQYNHLTQQICYSTDGVLQDPLLTIYDLNGRVLMQSTMSERCIDWSGPRNSIFITKLSSGSKSINSTIFAP